MPSPSTASRNLSARVVAFSRFGLSASAASKEASASSSCPSSSSITPSPTSALSDQSREMINRALILALCKCFFPALIKQINGVAAALSSAGTTSSSGSASASGTASCALSENGANIIRRTSEACKQKRITRQSPNLHLSLRHHGRQRVSTIMRKQDCSFHNMNMGAK